MIGQSAERVLRGGMPHVDYQETYIRRPEYMLAGGLPFGSSVLAIGRRA
jgi:hypothetical protein